MYSVFEGGPIPYPKREFLSDDDNEDKSSSKSATTSGANSTHGQPPAKRPRVNMPPTTSANMNISNYVSNTTNIPIVHVGCEYMYILREVIFKSLGASFQNEYPIIDTRNS